jgi:hypothetical protein
MQDRWWLIPSMAFVIPVAVGGRRLTFDLGMGLGAGTSSGYSSWSRYVERPFAADWEFQLAPTYRVHGIASLEVARSVEIFARADAAAMILPPGSGPSVTDSTWVLLSLGARFDLLKRP